VTQRHVALVLAAGGSTRLGQPKQLLTRAGETLVHRAARLAGEAGAAKVFVVVGAHAEAVSDAIRDLACEVIANPQWTEGLSSSLRHAAPRIAAARSPGLILGSDQPALDAAHLDELLRCARAAPSRCAATAYGADPGIPAVLPHTWFDDTDALHGDRGFRARLHVLGEALGRVVAPETLALDIDDQSDLEHARALQLID
jgi:molybdenum cofactor cytidylyltransferase